MSKILYTKFSRERRAQFQIMTQITEEEGEKRVCKLPLQDAAKAHVRGIQKNYECLSSLYTHPKTMLCPCWLDEKETKIVFPFVEGESLEERISRHGREQDFEAMKEDYRLLYEIISSAEGKEPFCAGEAFWAVFGNPDLPDGLWAAPCSNLDMIPGNLLIDGEKIQIVDYEWVFDFSIPFSFIYARSVFLQEAACALEREKQNELYAIAGIAPEDVPVYYRMEVRFQEYAAGAGEENVLSHFLESLHRKSYPVGMWEKEKMLYPLALSETGNSKREIYYEDCLDGDVQRSISLENTEENATLRLTLTAEDGVIKIRSLMGERGGRREILEFEHNAELVIVDDYYFGSAPRITFRNRGFDRIYLDYRIYWRGGGVASQFIGLIRQEKESRDQMEHSKWELEKERCKLEEMQRVNERLQGEKQFLSEELERMRQRKVVRMADKVHKVLKKE